MWNIDLYRKLLQEPGSNPYLKDKIKPTRDENVEWLASKLGYSIDTINSWAKSKTNGPSNPEVYLKLEDIFGVSFITSESENNMMSATMKENHNLNTFVRESIASCFCIMKDYLNSESVDEEQTYVAMRMELEKKMISIPQHIYKQIIGFPDTYLDPIIYNKKDTFSACYTEEIGHFENTVFKIEREEGIMKFIAAFTTKILEIEDALNEFAMTELYPYIVQ